jgi:peptide/nickel transport system substrate-binding protein
VPDKAPSTVAAHPRPAPVPRASTKPRPGPNLLLTPLETILTPNRQNKPFEFNTYNFIGLKVPQNQYLRKSGGGGRVPQNHFFTPGTPALLYGLACLTLLFLSGCRSPASSQPPGTVVFLLESMPANLDPRIGTDAQSQRLHSLIFSGLLERDERMDLHGDLADRWETPDPLTFVFHLRRGVEFHDGRALTSADVKFTFDSILSGAVKTPKRGAFRMVASVEAPDPFTVVFHLKEPFASFLWNVVRPSVGIVPAGSGPDFPQHPIGTGPFRFVRSSLDEEVVLERYPAYFAGAPHVERARFRIVPDATVRALELRKGTADAELNSLSPDMVAALARQPAIEVTQQPGTIYAYVAFNCEDPALAHREVRQALAYATDRTTILAYLYHGQARLADGLLPPNHWAAEPNVPHYAYDPARAEQLLDAAGFPRRQDGVRLRLAIKTSTDESARLLSAVLQDQWRRVGVALELRPLEIATLLSDIGRGNFQLYTLRWVGANNDPDIFEYVFSSRKIPPDGANRGRYRNPRLDALLDRARVESDREKRRAIYSQVQKIVAEDLPYLNLWFLDNISVHRRRVTHVDLTPAGDYDFLSGIALR